VELQCTCRQCISPIYLRLWWCFERLLKRLMVCHYQKMLLIYIMSTYKSTCYSYAARKGLLDFITVRITALSRFRTIDLNNPGFIRCGSSPVGMPLVAVAISIAVSEEFVGQVSVPSGNWLSAFYFVVEGGGPRQRHAGGAAVQVTFAVRSYVQSPSIHTCDANSELQ